MRQALLEALFTRCVFDLYTLRGSTLLSPLSQIKAQRGPPNLAKVTQVVHGKARAQTQRVWLEISAPVSTGVPLGGPPRARGHYLCRLLMLRHYLTEPKELRREQPTSWGAAQAITCARGHLGSQCMVLPSRGHPA